MSLRGLLERGIRSVLAEEDADGELADLVARQGLDGDSAEHIKQTLEAMPALLVAIEGSLRRPDVPEHARHLFRTVFDYVMTEDNLIPSHAGKPLLGLLDDVYLIHLAAIELEQHLGRVDMRSVTGGAQLLESALPPMVTQALRGFVEPPKRP
jgi:hypothetical protein